MSGDDLSKDKFFERVGRLAEEMIAAHGKDFAMGTLVLAARFIAEGKPLQPRGAGRVAICNRCRARRDGGGTLAGRVIRRQGFDLAAQSRRATVGTLVAYWVLAGDRGAARRRQVADRAGPGARARDETTTNGRHPDAR